MSGASDAGSPILAVRNLVKAFGALRVTDQVCLDLFEGARHALIGPNGAGKTTFVHQISGLLRPSSGSIHLFGEEITRLTPQQRVRRGMVRSFQINSLFQGLTVTENVCLPLLARSHRDGVIGASLSANKAVLSEAADLLEALQLADCAHVLVEALPYGRQRLVELALALALKPRVLLLDEPAAGITRNDTQMLLQTLRGLPSSIAILVIEHDMNFVFEFATDITVLVAGRVLVQGSPDDIRTDRDVRDIYLGRRHHA